MAATATVRDCATTFRAFGKLVEEEGEVVVTEKDAPKYRLTRYRSAGRKASPPKDYLARLRRHQPKALSAAAARALDDANRGRR